MCRWDASACTGETKKTTNRSKPTQNKLFSLIWTICTVLSRQFLHYEMETFGNWITQNSWLSILLKRVKYFVFKLSFSWRVQGCRQDPSKWGSFIAVGLERVLNISLESQTCNLVCFNLLLSNIRIYILHTVLYASPKFLTRRITSSILVTAMHDSGVV